MVVAILYVELFESKTMLAAEQIGFDGVDGDEADAVLVGAAADEDAAAELGEDGEYFAFGERDCAVCWSVEVYHSLDEDACGRLQTTKTSEVVDEVAEGGDDERTERWEGGSESD